MKLIQTITLGSSAATIDFTSIPSTYTDLLLLVSARATSTSGAITLSLNNSAANFTGRLTSTDRSVGTVTSSTATTTIGITSISTDSANTFGNFRIYIPNYANAQQKSFTCEAVSETNSGSAHISTQIGLWADTSVINRVTLNLSSFAQHSSASLYGITSGSGGATVT